jgi:hypothetical protein
MIINWWIVGILGALAIISLICRSHRTEYFQSSLMYSLPEVRRNMSYDLRGEADIRIPYTPVGPWNNPEVQPLVNRPMILV